MQPTNKPDDKQYSKEFFLTLEPEISIFGGRLCKDSSGNTYELKSITEIAKSVLLKADPSSEYSADATTIISKIKKLNKDIIEKFEHSSIITKIIYIIFKMLHLIEDSQVTIDFSDIEKNVEKVKTLFKLLYYRMQ